MKLFHILISCLMGSMVSAETQRSSIDYAPSDGPIKAQEVHPISLQSDEINIISGNLGDYAHDFSNDYLNHMCLWLSTKGEGERSLRWTLNSDTAAEYKVYGVASGGHSTLSLSCNDAPPTPTVTLTNTRSLGWDKVYLGTLALKVGSNTVTMKVEATKEFKFDALELVQEEVEQELLADALSMRQHPEWFKNAGYGLMFQWTNRATPPSGDIKSWEAKVNGFNLDQFLHTVDSSGASYVLWSVTWGQQYISAPLTSLDAIITGRTTKRDLLGEMADALAERGVKLIFYYHYGYDCNHSIDQEWMNASGGYLADKTTFYQNWIKIVSEMGQRYGKNLHGWWFDGGQRFYNCHFDNTRGDQGPLSAPFKELTLASRVGNPERIVSYNSWIKPRLTEYQDYYGGEGARSFSKLDNGIFPSGGKAGLQAHGCFILEKEWGHIKKDTPIQSPRHTLASMIQMIKKAKRLQYPLSINLEMYEDGSVSPESLELLKNLKDSL